MKDAGHRDAISCRVSHVSYQLTDWKQEDNCIIKRTYSASWIVLHQIKKWEPIAGEPT